MTTEKILRNFEQIIENDMLVHQYYMDPDYFDETLAKAGAPCGGHRMCAVGSLWVAAEQGLIPIPVTTEDGTKLTRYTLEGAEPDERGAALRTNLELGEAYRLLNAAAANYASKRGFYVCPGPHRTHTEYSDELEQLFEIHNAKRADLLKVARMALKKHRQDLLSA